MGIFLGLFVILCSLCIWIAEAQNCDERWVERGNMCYYLSETPEETTFDWYQARDWCLQNGGELASIEDQSESDFVIEKMGSSAYKGERWLGLNKLHSQEFVWSDGSSASFRYWMSREPETDDSCVLSKADLSVCFERYEGIDAVRSLLSKPSDADDVNTFSFGYWTGDDVDRCELSCVDKPGCEWWTYIKAAEPNVVWKMECLGRTNFNDVQDAGEHAISGKKIRCQGTWLAKNCGEQLGFICKKNKGDDTSRTVPPTTEIPGYCPANWIEAGNKCYLMEERDANNGEDWSSSLDICRGMGGNLASIHSMEANAAIVARLPEYAFGHWIGLRKNGDRFLWADQSRVNFTNFASDISAPNSCTELITYPGQPGDWRATGCTQKQGYICQKYKDGSISTPPSTSSHSCQSGYNHYGGHCYKFHSTPIRFDLAEAMCSSEGGHLASIQYGTENAALLLQAAGQLPAWIGLQQYTIYDDEFRWTDNWPVDYVNWAPGEPSSGGGMNAGMMGTDGRWKSVSRDTPLGFFCRVTNAVPNTTPTIKPGVCPGDDWKEFGGHCYYSPRSGLTTYAEAKTKCTQDAGRHFTASLAAIHSLAENDFIRTAFPHSYTDLWIGMSKEGFGSPWKWEDGSTVQYTRWAPGEPNDQDGTENCVEMYRRVWPGLWNDVDCTTRNNYICKADKGPPLTTPSLPPVGEGACPSSDWEDYGENCFLFETETEHSWNNAQEQCVTRANGNRQAQLASVQNSQEDWFIWQKLRAKNTAQRTGAWFGMIKQPDKDAPWTWWDGTSSGYRNWGPGEPNDSDGTQNCVEMYIESGVWNDHMCEEKRGYVCRMLRMKSTLTPPSTLSTGASRTTALVATGGGLSQTAVAGIAAGVVGAVILIAAAVGLSIMIKKQRDEMAKLDRQNVIRDPTLSENSFA